MLHLLLNQKLIKSGYDFGKINKASTKIILKARSKHLCYLEAFSNKRLFWFDKSPSINFYNFLKSKKWPKIRKSRGFRPLKIEPMELRNRKKDVWGFIHPKTASINKRPVHFFFQKPCSF